MVNGWGCKENAAGMKVCIAVGNPVVGDAHGAAGCNVMRGAVADAVCSGWYGFCTGNGNAINF